jgi:hypothetical protein
LKKEQQKRSPKLAAQPTKESVLQTLQDEQREIEAKLKFIDSLIN